MRILQLSARLGRRDERQRARAFLNPLEFGLFALRTGDAGASSSSPASHPPNAAPRTCAGRSEGLPAHSPRLRGESFWENAAQHFLSAGAWEPLLLNGCAES